MRHPANIRPVAQPLRRQIVILNAAVLLPAFAVIAWSTRQTYLEQLEQLETESRSLATVIVVYLERGLDIASAQSVIETIPLPPHMYGTHHCSLGSQEGA